MHRSQNLRRAVVLAVLTWVWLTFQTLAQTYSVPVRWCVTEGAQADVNPGCVGEPDTDWVLWRRHERPTDHTFQPFADITFRSAMRLIRDDQELDFPVISIPTPMGGDPGDLLGPVCTNDASKSCGEDADCPGTGKCQFSTDMDMAYTECVKKWDEILKQENGEKTNTDIGIVAIAVGRLRQPDGTLSGFWGWTQGGRRLWVRDNAWHLCGSCEAANPGHSLQGNTPGCGEDSDWLAAHELGHNLGLNHPQDTSNDINVMRNAPREGDIVDGIYGNFLLSNSIEDDTSQIVNQISVVRNRAPNIPGCKIADTNMDCSTQSDLLTDPRSDVSPPALDLFTVRAIDRVDDDLTEITHEVVSPFTAEQLAPFNDEMDYFFVADLDNDPNTGGSPRDLGIPSACEGAELVTRTRVISPGGTQVFIPVVVPTVWKFQGGAFVEVNDPSVEAEVQPVTAFGDGDSGVEASFHARDLVVLRLSNQVRGPRSVPFRAHALSRGVPFQGPAVVDELDTPTGDNCFEIKWEFPRFPVCSVSPDPASPGSSATVDAAGLTADSDVHVVFDTLEVAQGLTDANGEVSVPFEVPSDATAGGHLLTVGIGFTALTADCTVSVVREPAGPGFWHRQCLGLTDSSGIDPGRNGRGPQAPTEPNFEEALIPCADRRLEALGFQGVSTCEGIDADPPNNSCEKALKQLTTLILNVCSGRLADRAAFEVRQAACTSSTVGGLIDDVAALIQRGNCREALQCAAPFQE